MEKKYYLKQEQLFNLQYSQREFDSTSDLIKELCSSEKSDIEYGFQLGVLYKSLREHYLRMSDLLEDIVGQELDNGK